MKKNSGHINRAISAPAVRESISGNNAPDFSPIRERLLSLLGASGALAFSYFMDNRDGFAARLPSESLCQLENLSRSFAYDEAALYLKEYMLST